MNKLKKKILFIILPKNDLRFTNDSSPIKGAIALANSLSEFIYVKIVSTFHLTSALMIS